MAAHSYGWRATSARMAARRSRGINSGWRVCRARHRLRAAAQAAKIAWRLASSRQHIFSPLGSVGAALRAGADRANAAYFFGAP